MAALEELLSYTLLDLCETKTLKKITVTELLNKAELSRQAFYSRFHDKNDLICYVYSKRILVRWNPESTDSLEMDYYTGCLDYFERMQKHRSFLLQACDMDEQNCLTDYMIQQAAIWESSFFKKHYDHDILPAHIRYAVEYHSFGSMNMSIKWLKDGTSLSPGEIASQNTRARFAALGSFLK